ncbi:MAG: DUF192 domain-containing protein [Candidatus Competibacteraceae bacterium]|nr:DUF192 domain-containing protein [Candidatus Competibacteraceae bacterium]
MRLWRAFGLAMLVALALPQPVAVNAQLALDKVTVVTANARHDFEVELANTDETRARGLMHRRFLPANRGMLFDMGRIGEASFWMQNTYIPLDILFIRPDGTIAKIAENTQPLSTRTVSSGEPVLGVLEINGGLSAKLEIRAGDRVVHPLFAGR